MFAIILLATAANAHEFSLELGTLGTPDDNVSQLLDAYSVPSKGARFGYRFTDHISAVADYQYSQLGGSVEVYDDENNYDESGFNMALRLHQIGVGPKLDVEVWPWLHPYVTAQFLGLVGALRLDDAPYDDNNPNELREYGFAPGGVAAAGFDLVFLRADRAVRPATNLELGYAYEAPLALGDMGSLDFRGFYLRWGVGARF